MASPLRSCRVVLLMTLVFASGCSPAPTDPDAPAEIAARRARVLEVARAQLLGTGRWQLDRDPPANRSVNDVGKHWWPRLLAELAAAPDPSRIVAGAGRRNGEPADATVAEIVRGLVHHAPDDRPGHDNPAIGYLYFSPVGLGWAVHAHPALFRDEDWRTLVRATIDYDPSLSALNAFTGQGTENHVLMGRTGGYLVCAAVVARGPDDPVTGAWFARAEAWLPPLREYFVSTARTTFDRGLGEWDSSIYYPYVASCWLALHEFASDPQVREAATAMLDWMAATVAVRVTDGIFGGAEQRSGAPTAPGQSNLDQLAWLWWGGLPGGAEPVWRGQDFGQLVYASLSRYQPPALFGRIARKELPAGRHGLQFETKPSYVVHGDAAVRQQTRVLFEIAPGYTLGAAIARPTGGWTGGDNQDLLWKLVARPRTAGGAPVVVHGGLAREPWRQVGMWEGVLIDVWHLPENAGQLRDEALAKVAAWREERGRHLKRVFPGDTSRENTVRPRQVAVQDARARLVFGDGREAALPADGSPAFHDLGGAFIAVRALGAGLEPIPPGGFGGYLLEVGDAADFPSLEAFGAAVRARDSAEPPAWSAGRLVLRTLSGTRLEFAHRADGTYVEPEYDWGYGDEPVGGTVIPAQPPSRYPEWPSGPGHGRVPELVVDGVPVADRFDAAAYHGPVLEVRNQVMSVTDGRERWVVDYRGERPVWKRK